MVQPNLGKLVRVDPKAVWQHEAQEFTPWLADNLTLLNEALGLEIERIETEMPVGDFAVDIFGKEVGSDREVIIENQLGPTDHGHLGQLMTYAAGLDAKVVIWISPHFRDEHKQALDWLNRGTNEGLAFFGVQLELLQIGDSLPAPNFKVLAQPSEWQERVEATVRREVSERGLAYHEFFTDVLSRLKTANPSFTTSRTVRYDNWKSFSVGRTGFSVVAEFMTGPRLLVHLYIDTGSKDTNKLAFDQLLMEQDSIEQALGEKLAWDRLDHRRASRVHVEHTGGVDSPPESLESLKNWAVDHLLKFKDVFGPRVRALRLEAQPEAQELLS